MTASGAHHLPITADQPDTAEARALAEALTQLLARDDEPPARWLAPAFADAVGRARAEQHADAWGHGLAHGLVAAAPLTFHVAVARLAHDPRSVAVAIRHLEIAGARRLPSWPELIRRRLPAAPTGFDASLWFG
jgi:hypothetical protein